MSTFKGSNGREVRLTGLSVVKGQLYRRPTIDVLPDGVLLEVFNFYLERRALDAWHKLVHVCRKWRQVVFASPRRLNLRLLCTSRTPAKKLLNIWPAFPIVIKHFGRGLGPRCTANVDAALKHSDRVREIGISPVAGPLLNSMKEPFPALTSLDLWLRDGEHAPPVLLPNSSFLGGSAPRLRILRLCGIPFPELPNLLLSAHNLVQLLLYDIPDSGFISPKAMVTCLSSLTDLRELALEFRSPRSHPVHQTNRRRPPLTHTVLPSLTSLSFRGVSEYLEDVVARIDAPLLNDIFITFFNQLIFDTPLLRSFINRTEVFKVFHRAEILFSYNCVEVALLREGRARASDGLLRLGISCNLSDWQLSSLARLCDLSLPPLPTLERLDICEYQHGPEWQDDMEDTQWLELLHPFTSAKSLYLDKKFAPRVAPALKELAREGVTEVLPGLQNVFVQARGPGERAIAEFVAARQLVGHPVAVQDWDGRRL